MELGSWSIIQAPSLLALIPLVVMIVLIFRGKSNVSAIMVGVLVGALLLGQDLGAMAKAFATSLGSSTALIGLIIMMGAGLGVLMSEAGVTHTLVYWIVKRIGVNTQTKGDRPGGGVHHRLRPAGHPGRRQRRHRPHHAAHHGLPGGHPHRGGHPVQGGG